MEILVDEKSLDSTFLNAKINCIQWKTKNPPKCVILISHGYAEHHGWYKDMATFLNSKDIYVFIHDHLGHGKSGGDVRQIDSYSYFCEDTFLHIEKIRSEFPASPIYGIGHSMGGAILTKCELMKPGLFSGLVLIGPMLSVVVNPVVRFIACNLGRYFPNMPIPGVNPNYISTDLNVVERYKNDPLVIKANSTAQFGLVCLNLMKDINEEALNFKAPVLILHGEEDKLIPVQSSQSFYDNISSDKKEFRTYKTSYHQIHNEPDGIKERCLNDIFEWINKLLTD